MLYFSGSEADSFREEEEKEKKGYINYLTCEYYRSTIAGSTKQKFINSFLFSMYE